MPEKICDTQPPRRLARLAFRAPVWLYRARLGFLLGKRFLLLNHIGRVSGAPRQAVLEIIEQNPRSHTYYVASVYGEKSVWHSHLLSIE